MKTIDFNKLRDHKPTKESIYLAKLIHTRRAMEKPGFDFDGCEPEMAKREADELIKKLDHAKTH